MEVQAQNAARWWSESGEATVIVLDNYSIHKSHEIKARIPQWEKQHLYLFYLPEYCCEWNRIEEEWNQLKRHEISGKMFEDEYDLAVAVMAAIEKRSQEHGYVAERFRFPSSRKVS